jgi:hypothetical protein
MIKLALRIVLFTFLLIAGTTAAVWMANALPTPAMFSLAAGALAFSSGAALWRLWAKGGPHETEAHDPDNSTDLP